MSEVRISSTTQVVRVNTNEVRVIVSDGLAGSGGGTTYEVVSSTADGLAPMTDNVAGQALFDDGVGGVVWRSINASDIVPAFAIASFSGGGTLEVGQSVVNPGFTASYTSGPPTSATLTDTEGNAPVALSTPFTAVTSPNTFTKTANNASVTFTLSATKGSTLTATAAYAWRPRAFWGVGVNGLSTEAAIEALANSALSSSRARSFTLAPGSGEHIYYAYPASYGAATFTVGGFEGGFELVSAAISVTNTYGVAQDYRLYKSTNANLGSTSVVVS